jgi:exodeoxyribonuclease V alpha subunit
MEVRGIGFHKADEIARARGGDPDSPQRIGAGAVHLLEQASARDGHMFVRRPELCRRTRKLLASDAGREDEAIDELCRRQRLRAVGEAIFLRRLENAERTVAERLRALLGETAEPLVVDVELAISKFEDRERIVLAEAQRQTLREMVASKVMVLTGGPGTGKTTLTKGIVYVASLAGLTVALAAPTGRAARRLGEATGVKAKTVHRLLGYQGETFVHDENDPLEVDLLVIDEASMLDAPLAAHLLRALKDSVRLVIVGDVDQLPSVGPGRVLGDLIESAAVPVVRLTEIFRQAQKSLIVVNAHRVIHGRLPEPGGSRDEADFFSAHRPDPAAALAEVTDLVADRIANRYGFEPLRDIQVLAPMRRGLLGVENLNAALQERLNPRGEARKWSRRLRSGDRVMQTTNNYELEVFNGEIGTVIGFDSESRKVLVDLEGRIVGYPTQNLEELELAYAVTIHKSQGSEFPCVVIVLHDQHRIMLQRNLFYTAITRGKQLVLVVGTRQAVATAVRTETTQRRETLLVERLQGRLPELTSTMRSETGSEPTDR